MARSSGPAGGNNAAFNAAYKQAMNPAGPPGGISSATPENVAKAYGESGSGDSYLSTGENAYQKAPNIFVNIPQPGTRGYRDFSSITSEPQTAEEAVLLGEQLAELGLGPTEYAGYFYNPKDPYDTAYEEKEKPGKPAQIIDVPTSSTNYSRPRTIAAGWTQDPDNEELGTLTVVFRDGTPYNFYGVPRSEWLSFQASISKGRPFLNRANSVNKADGKLLKYPHGPADVSQLSPEMQQMIYVDARAKQIYYRNTPNAPKYYQQKWVWKAAKNVTSRDRVVTDASGQPRTKNGRVLVKKRVRTTGTTGRPAGKGINPNRMGKASNPSQNAGKNPYQ